MPRNEVRKKCTAELVDKLYNIGLIRTKRLKTCSQITVHNFCKRRLPVFIINNGMLNAPLAIAGKGVLMKKIKLFKNFDFYFHSFFFFLSVKYVQHGHVRVGPNVVRDPAFFINRDNEDFINWADSFKQKINTYKDERDDYVE